MKLLYIANARIPTEKAHGVQIMNTCAALAATGVEVVLLVPRRKTITEDPFQYYGIDKQFSIIKVPCFDTVMWGPMGFFLQSVSFALSAAWHVATHTYDAVYSRDPLALVMAPHRVRVFELHTALTFPLRYFTRVIAISGGLATYAKACGVPADRVHVVHDAAVLAPLEDKLLVRDRLGISSTTLVVGYVGKYKTMGVEKGVKQILAAVGSLVKEHPVLMLVVGLEESEVAEVRSTAAEEGIPPQQLMLVTHVPHQRALDYMRAADILVMNYPNLPHYALYMSPLKLFEYAASGNAIVSSDLPSVREVLSDETAAFFEPGDQSGLTTVIASLLANAELRASLGTRVRDVASQNTYILRAQKILTVVSAR